MFFNKEGYPYNFQYDTISKTWNGKIFFDENSSDTFRTLCVYVFEDVKPYSFENDFDLRESQLFNWSGTTFIGKTYENETITNIQKVNSSPVFYSKWIYGTDFDKKFPIGSVIYFSDVSGIGIGDRDFLSNGSLTSGVTFFDILGHRKNAILVETQTSNDIFDYTFVSGSISSANIIKVLDYGQQKLVDMNNLNYYKDKKLSIVNSTSNNGVFTYRDYNILNNKIYDFALLSGITASGSTISMEIELFTQRPELYEGNVNITYNNSGTTGTVIEFANGINTTIDFVSTGQTIIFEDINGNYIDPNNATFTITGFADTINLTTDTCKFYTLNDLNYLETSNSFTGFTYNDIIHLTAIPNYSGLTFHDNRSFQVLDIQNGRIEVAEYIIPESGYTYRIDKILNKKRVKKLYATQGGNSVTWSGFTTCFSTVNKLYINQDILNSGSTTYFYQNTITAIRNKYKNMLNRYGFDIYHWNNGVNDYMVINGLDYNWNPYFSAKASINTQPLTLGKNFDYFDSGTTMTGVTDAYYFNVDEQLTNESIYLYDTSKLAHNFKTTILFDLGIDSLNYGFKLNINQNDYYIPLSGTVSTCTIDTINSFVDKYYTLFDQNGVTLSSGSTSSGYTLTLEGQYPNVEIVNLEVKVNSYSTYDIIENTINHSMVICGNELYSVSNNLFDYELATGMIISISGSTHTLNNKQYNILRLAQDTGTTVNPTSANVIQLSYQGPFFYGYNENLTISVNEFLRKPRGNYNKQVYYKMSWEEPYDDSIFYYDYSGDQIQPNGNLTYIGPKPLFNSGYTNLVYLNKNPNTNPLEISNPEYQQTIFDELVYPLEEYNSDKFFDYHPVPMEIFLGFNTPNEGVIIDTMKIEQIEYTTFSGTTSSSNRFVISGNTINYTTSDIFFNFNNVGLEEGQNISINFLEITVTGQTLYESYDISNIVDLTDTKIIVNNTNLPYFDTSASGKTYTFIINVEPYLIASIQLFGQTEIEDDRFEQNLKLLGANLGIDAYPIYKESDIQDQGIDFTILNRKRKELLSVYPEIYNYIGSYKALINAINYFGYNDLDLYEYYRNIKQGSLLYGKLHKTLIEDIFNRSVPGWTSNEPDSKNYKKTNLFNLTYKITDFDGNYINIYSLNEVQTKLTGLVKWLRSNIIPLSANILDITGLESTVSTMYMDYDPSTYVRKIALTQQVNAINFNYIQTLNTGSDYLMTVNFYMITGCTMPDYYTVRIKTYRLNNLTNELEPVQYHELYKKDLLSYSFNVDVNVDPYMYIETESYNGYGLGIINNKLFNYNEGRAFMLVNTNFNSLDYRYFTTDYGYYIIDSGRFYIIRF
jgi:hypothetical protein